MVNRAHIAVAEQKSSTIQEGGGVVVQEAAEETHKVLTQ